MGQDLSFWTLLGRTWGKGMRERAGFDNKSCGIIISQNNFLNSESPVYHTALNILPLTGPTPTIS